MKTVPNRPLALAIMACRNIDFLQRKDGTSETTVYQTIRIGNSNNLCQINGYKVYAMKNDAEGNRILVDESGNKYKVTIKFDQAAHKYHCRASRKQPSLRM